MAEDLFLPETDQREAVYLALLPQLEALLDAKSDAVANVGNLIAGLKEAFGFLWVGCYFVRNNELHLGPFQGPVACTRIAKGKGVCGAAWERNEDVLVPNVDLFPGHIACSSKSKSELVLPIRNTDGGVIGVLDVDSAVLNDFSEIDRMYLRQIVSLIERVLA
jgi:L-methionine (R)-S-oxide reductase